MRAKNNDIRAISEAQKKEFSPDDPQKFTVGTVIDDVTEIDE
jgi:hypothetical protein